MMPTVPTNKEGPIAKGFDMGSIEKTDATSSDHAEWTVLDASLDSRMGCLEVVASVSL